MELEKYLKAILECPDERVEGEHSKLTLEHGVYDNWPIFLNHDFKKFVELLKNTERYQIVGEYQEKGRIFMDYIPGTVRIQIFDHVPEGFTTGQGSPHLWIGEKKLHCERQLRDYTMGLTLHPYQKKEMVCGDRSRPMAIVINEMGRLAINNNISLCFPNSKGWKNLDDLSRIVYYP